MTPPLRLVGSALVTLALMGSSPIGGSASTPAPPSAPSKGPQPVRTVEELQSYVSNCENAGGLVLLALADGELTAACVRLRFSVVEVPE